MKPRVVAVLCSFLACLLLACAPEAPKPPTPNPDNATPARKENWESIAERIVRQSAAVKENDIVQISGGVREIELLEDIAVQVRKAGAFPLLRLNSDRLDKRMFTDVPEKYDAQVSAMEMKLADAIDVSIAVDSRLSENLLADIDPKRLDARDKANQTYIDELLKRNVRQVYVSNGLYPTPWIASRLGMTESELAKTFWNGVDVDYSSLQKAGEEVKKVLEAGKELHITHPNGTDLKMRIEGKPVVVSDGIISPEDAKKGGSNAVVYLPAGEVLQGAVQGTATGKIVHTRDFFYGQEIQNLTLTLTQGKVTAMTGSGPGFGPLKKRYDAAGPGKDSFAGIDLGINPEVKLPASAKVGTWIPSGTITVAIGNDAWIGGTNRVAFGYSVFLPGSTVTLDGKTLIANGELKTQ